MATISIKHHINDTVQVPLVGIAGQVVGLHINEDGIERNEIRYKSTNGTVVEQWFRAADLIAVPREHFSASPNRQQNADALINDWQQKALTALSEGKTLRGDISIERANGLLAAGYLQCVDALKKFLAGTSLPASATPSAPQTQDPPSA